MLHLFLQKHWVELKPPLPLCIVLSGRYSGLQLRWQPLSPSNLIHPESLEHSASQRLCRFPLSPDLPPVFLRLRGMPYLSWLVSQESPTRSLSTSDCKESRSRYFLPGLHARASPEKASPAHHPWVSGIVSWALGWYKTAKGQHHIGVGTMLNFQKSLLKYQASGRGCPHTS